LYFVQRKLSCLWVFALFIAVTRELSIFVRFRAPYWGDADAFVYLAIVSLNI
jgi:hypothetical protein